MHYYHANKYVISSCLKQPVLLIGSCIISVREFQAIGPATEKRLWGLGDGIGIRWTMCKQSAPRSRQITI